MEYREFLESKMVIDKPSGHEPVDINPQLFDFQKDLVSWAVRRGRAAQWPVAVVAGIFTSPQRITRYTGAQLTGNAIRRSQIEKRI